MGVYDVRGYLFGVLVLRESYYLIPETLNPEPCMHGEFGPPFEALLSEVEGHLEADLFLCVAFFGGNSVVLLSRVVIVNGHSIADNSPAEFSYSGYSHRSRKANSGA